MKIIRLSQILVNVDGQPKDKVTQFAVWMLVVKFSYFYLGCFVELLGHNLHEE